MARVAPGVLHHKEVVFLGIQQVLIGLHHGGRVPVEQEGIALAVLLPVYVLGLLAEEGDRVRKLINFLVLQMPVYYNRRGHCQRSHDNGNQ